MQPARWRAWLCFPLLLWMQNLAAEHLRIGSYVPIPSVQAYENAIAAAYCRAGLSVEFVRMPFKRALQEANDGLLDGNLVRFTLIEANASNLIKVPETLPPLVLAYLALKDFPAQVTEDTESLYRAGYFAGLSLFEKQQWKPASIAINGSYEQLVSLLKANRIDIAVAGYWDAALLLEQNPQLRLVGRREIQLPVYHYIHRRHAALAGKLAAALLELKATGLITEMMARGAQDFAAHQGDAISHRRIGCSQLLITP